MKYSIFIPVFILFFGLSLLPSCQNETLESPADDGYAYFPIDSAHTVIYRADTTYYDLFSTSVFVNSWRIEEKIMDVDTDSEGFPRVRIERRKWVWGSDYSAEVQPISLYATRSDRELDYQDNNTRYMKLVFPVYEERTWDGTIYFNQFDFETNDFLDDANYENYEYSSVNSSETIGTFALDSVLTVEHFENESQLNKYYSQEKYAKNIGLVYRKSSVLGLSTNDLSQYIGIEWPERANDGFEAEWTLLEYR